GDLRRDRASLPRAGRRVGQRRRGHGPLARRPGRAHRSRLTGGPMTTPDDRDPDPERLKEFAKHVFGALSGAMTSAMICLGDRLGLYRALANDGPANSSELARRTGLSERWLRE